MKGMFCAAILENRRIAEDVFDMRLKCEAAKTAAAGQFAAVYTNNPATLLPRPLSICEIDKISETLRIVYRVAGKGTLDLSKAREGGELRLLAPLGNGFSLDLTHKNFVVAGGGIGVPPLLELVKKIRGEIENTKITVCLGFRGSKDVILEQDFARYADIVQVSTDDGTYGTSANVVDMLIQLDIKPDAAYGCGPKVMLQNFAKWAADLSTVCYVSLEERMACSVGACLACVVKTRKDGGVAQARVCYDGPIFNAKELTW